MQGIALSVRCPRAASLARGQAGRDVQGLLQRGDGPLQSYVLRWTPCILQCATIDERRPVRAPDVALFARSAIALGDPPGNTT